MPFFLKKKNLTWGGGRVLKHAMCVILVIISTSSIQLEENITIMLLHYAKYRGSDA